MMDLTVELEFQQQQLGPLDCHDTTHELILNCIREGHLGLTMTAPKPQRLVMHECSPQASA